ncbi:DUF4956 domain-containing protein [Enterococcus plantarum]|uniref:DUF4956 domain-containing protein n=1 Tax=Enterococcus TaxID=1350 RepID=UPI00084D802B|nr:DUF4956 domain-containing protein [Enterococcus plantarum]MBO0421806.1 DUF4956 domain-containing protein [Enterococcus plantarum]MBO0468392.1 DUF4956 domain-containing protein [Enterococcus plantarum]OEG21031.1 DUF4956 domain-containing protein [Enterococcus plantarum]
MLSSLLVESSVDVSIKQLLICIVVSVLLGLLVAYVHMYRNIYSKNFVITLAVLPVLVQLVIMLVNGNLGTGVAVLGAFSLIRFRSVAGGAREITSIFWSMGIGLATGMGYVSYITIFSLIIALFLLVLNTLHFGEKQKLAEREVKITIPEDLDYPGLFDDLFQHYTYSAYLDSVKTTNMGSLYELRYRITLKDSRMEKELMDAMRIRNGNLTIVSGKVSTNREEL